MMYRGLVSRQSLTAQAAHLRPRRTGTPGAFRQNSSSSSASDVAKNAQQKATEALGSAQKIAEKGFEQLKGVGGKVGETTGNMLGSYRQPLVYNLSVLREIAKQVYRKESLAPPTNLSTFTTTYQSLFARARDVNYWRGIAQTGEWTKVAVYGLEAYFIFNIGEMIGRRHIVGYKTD